MQVEYLFHKNQNQLLYKSRYRQAPTSPPSNLSFFLTKSNYFQMAANSSSLQLHVLIFIILCSFLLIGAGAVVEQSFGWPAEGGCRGSMAECMGFGHGHGGDDDEFFDMDTEINRRILATTNYISYGALQRNTVPCSRRGASYYNCKPGAEANPYTRGCTSITRCRS